MERLKDATDICLSGGADGADIEWGTCAQSIGHKVIHWSFAGHNSQAPEDQLVRLDYEQLKLADEALGNAASTLGKYLPSRPTISSLLKRNYYQVAWSGSCYAVATIKENLVPGGTGWAITMFIQLHPDNTNLYLFDQEKDTWFQFNSKTWDRIDSPPRPAGIWAGIGSRQLEQNGRDAIRELMGCPKKET